MENICFYILKSEIKLYVNTHTGIEYVPVKLEMGLNGNYTFFKFT